MSHDLKLAKKFLEKVGKKINATAYTNAPISVTDDLKLSFGDAFVFSLSPNHDSPACEYRVLHETGSDRIEVSPTVLECLFREGARRPSEVVGRVAFDVLDYMLHVNRVDVRKYNIPYTGPKLVKGRVYRAKKPKRVGFNNYDDRMIVFLGPSTVQYDSPTIRNGRHYPTVDILAFMAWVGSDITDITPVGDWATA